MEKGTGEERSAAPARVDAARHALDYERPPRPSATRRRDLLVGALVILVLGGPAGYCGFCACGIVTDLGRPWGLLSFEARVSRVLAGVTAAVLVFASITLTARWFEPPNAEDDEDHGGISGGQRRSHH
jgi:hypothetical protein